MEMSLDDIIKQNKGSKSRRGGFVSRRGSSLRGGRKPGGGVMRGRGRGGISRSPPSFGRSRRGAKARDAFLGSTSPRKFGSDSTKLIVSNLDYGVTDSDIIELFSEFGPLKSAGVHYDRSGRSLGSADLIYERRADAIKAMKQYNGVPLDGREMNIQLATSEIPSPIRGGIGGFRRGSSPMRGSRGRGGSRGSFRGRGGRGGSRGAGAVGRGGAKTKAPTAEELDAELEEYVKSKVSSSEGA
ncbi:THO complex subunit 4-like [Phymastichus coffea]|uniref:THO complex subunit 4-like n=1 Tax=Phymastichus coffea TaxID=108790 RepID=UPI00273BCBB7|nr:THO complex subunit 4-like [Phymastichus coffea]